MAQAMLVETLPASLPARTTPKPKPKRKKHRGRQRPPPVLRLVAPPRFFAVSCGVCDAIGPLATTWVRAINPPRKHGWIECTIAGLTVWLCWVCNASYRRLLPPPTRGDCLDGPRPCPHSLCRHHMQDGISRKAPADFELTETCALDVVDKHDEGMTLNQIGDLLCQTREGIRYTEFGALTKLRAAGIDMEQGMHRPEHPLSRWESE